MPSSFDLTKGYPYQEAAGFTAQVEVGPLPVPDSKSRQGMHNTRMVPVASNTSAYTAGVIASDGGRHSRLRHTVLTGAYEVRLVYGNFYVDTSTFVETLVPNPITVRASLEVTTAGTSNSGGNYRFQSGSAAYLSSATYSVNDACVFGGNTFTAKAFVATSNPPAAGGTALWSQNQIIPVHFPGENATTRDVTIAPGQIVISNPITIDAATGTLLFSNTLVQPNNGTANTGSYPLAQSNFAAMDFVLASAAGVAPADFTINGPGAVTPGGAGTTYGPMAIIGTPVGGVDKTPVIVMIGDSLGAGAGDSGTVNGNEGTGWMMRAFSSMPNMRITKGGDSNTRWGVLANSTQRRTLLATGTYMVNQLITNDIAGAGSLAAMQALLIAQWNLGANRGLKVYQGTCTPQTNTTDAWATVVNQSPRAGFGPASTWSNTNAWLLDGAPMLAGVGVATGSNAGGTLRAGAAGHPLTGVIDVAAACTDATTTWAWKAGGTVDGTHPVSALHIAMAALVPITQFV